MKQIPDDLITARANDRPLVGQMQEKQERVTKVSHSQPGPRVLLFHAEPQRRGENVNGIHFHKQFSVSPRLRANGFSKNLMAKNCISHNNYYE